MSAHNYNEIRRIIFSTANNPNKGFLLAHEWLDTTYKSKLGYKGYSGLKAELNFYQRYGQDFKLTVAGDMGEHADFSGMYGSLATRFDVTTNIDYKKFSEYEPFMGNGISYKIALYDKTNFEVIDVLDLAFPKCQWCGEHEIPFVALLGENYNRHGMPLMHNDQPTFSVCIGCQSLRELKRNIDYIPSPSEYFERHAMGETEEQRLKSTQQYNIEQYKYFRREFTDNLMGIASHNYQMTDRKGDGYWSLNFTFQNRAVSDVLPFEIECGHDI